MPRRWNANRRRQTVKRDRLRTIRARNAEGRRAGRRPEKEEVTSESSTDRR